MRIDAYPAALTPDGTEVFPLMQGGHVRSATLSQLSGLFGGSGGGGAETFVFPQGSAASTWTINHNLGRYPSVTVTDSTGRMVDGDVTYVSANQVVLQFSGAFSGTAYCN